MALNFPIPTSVGQVYQDPTSGNTYVCTSLGPPAQWVGSGSSTSLDSTYLRRDASNDPVTGNLLLNPTTNVSPLTLQQPVGNTTPALKIENSGSGNSIESNGFAVSNTGAITLGTALAIANGGTGATSQSAARTNLGATTVGDAVFIAADAAAGRLAIGAEQEVVIIENANGTVMRLPRIGRQICMATPTNNIIANAASGSLFFSTFLVLTFPAEFTELTSLVVSGRGIPGVATGWAIHAGVSPTGFAAYSYATVNGGGCRVSYVAIGTYTP